MCHNQFVTKFRKNGLGDEVWVQIVKINHRDLIDIRVFMPKVDGPGCMPTRKGICLDISLLPQLKKAVLSLEKAIKKMDKIL